MNSPIWLLAAAVLRRRKLVLSYAIALSLLVGASVFLKPRLYSANAAFVTQDAPAPNVNMSQIALQLGIATGRVSAGSPQLYADLLESRELLRRLISTRFEVGGDRPFRGDLFDYFKIKSRESNQGLAEALNATRELIDVKHNRTTGMVSVEVQTRNPELSIAVVRELLSLLNDYNLRRRQSQARTEREFTELRLREAQKQLSDAENQLAAFHQSNRQFSQSPALAAEEARLQRNVTMRQQLFVTLSQNYEVARLDEVRSTPVITVIERPEGFAEPQRRGTIKKAALGGFLGLILGIAVVSLQHLFGGGASGRQGYEQFREALQETVRPFRRARALR